ncbi:MAG: M23 family metallopeptidase [Desulfobacteraceae bacterium]|nr:M23 family metallopeptidase [Desulfobacteraceae bacterium]
MKAKMPRLAQLEKENEQKKNQFMNLAQRIDQINQEMVKLKQLDHKLKIMVNLETPDNNSQLQGVGGPNPTLLDPKHAMTKAHKELVHAMYQSLDNLDNEIALGEQDKAELHKFLESQKMLLASTPSIWPTRGWLSSSFGYRTSPFTGKKEFHKAIDIATRKGAPIVAAANGVVSQVGRDGGLGRVLTVKHGYGLVTRYAHLEKALVRKGQFIKRGEAIALVGNSGRSTGPHLHYEVYLNRVPVNPLHYILN